MNDSSQQIVKCLPGFQCFVINDRQIPDCDTLLRLLRPNIEPKTAILVVSSTLDSEEETRSQLILRNHNNFIVSWLPEISMLDTTGVARSIGEKIEQAFKGLVVKGVSLKFDMWRYHIARLSYLDYFFFPRLRSDEKPEDSAEVMRDYKRYMKTGEWESKTVEKHRKNTEEIKQKIRQNFPEYEISEFWHEFFMEMAWRYFRDEFDRLHAGTVTTSIENRDRRRRNYRQPIEKRLVKSPVPWQCQFCHKWYQREQAGNGKPRVKCERCFKDWDRSRRRKKNP
jgi:hypothetical protein